jgi:phosphate:Na+ symporter
MNTVDTLEIGAIIIGLLGGLALFLFGMEQMTDALKSVAGGRMKKLLARLTTNRFNAVFAGAFVTAVIQSSSVTTVLVVGFISAGLMTLSQSIGVIMGANIGTTITAQIVAFKVTQYALVLVAGGFALLFLAKRKRVQQYGLMIMGLGLIFFGMELMGDSTRPLRTYQPFIDLMQQMDNPLLAILVSALFTSIIQSSSATTGVIIVLASQGFITLETGIALAFGANLGTCITALLAAIGKPREAVQAAMIHVLFNVLGIVIWLGFIDQLAALVRWFSPTAPDLTGAARLAAETPRQIANAHSVFNVANTLIFIGFATPLAWLVERLIPERPKAELELVRPKFLDDILLTTPELALDRVRLELGRLGVYTLRMVREALPTVFHGTEEDLSNLADMDDDVDALYGGIVTYLGRLSQENLLAPQSDQLADYMAVANHIENIGDMIETNMVEAGSARLKHEVHMSEATQTVLQALHDKIYWAVEGALVALITSDQYLAEEVMAAKLEINWLANEAERHLARRLTADEPHRLAAFRIESEIIEYLKRVYYFAKRIAKVTADADAVYRQVELSHVPQEVLTNSVRTPSATP